MMIYTAGTRGLTRRYLGLNSRVGDIPAHTPAVVHVCTPHTLIRPQLTHTLIRPQRLLPQSPSTLSLDPGACSLYVRPPLSNPSSTSSSQHQLSGSRPANSVAGVLVFT
eukprot:711973-Rhodomonas_salina.1